MYIPKKKPGPRSKMPKAERLRTLYMEHTAQEIANMYNVSLATVRGWIRKTRVVQKEGTAS